VIFQPTSRVEFGENMVFTKRLMGHLNQTMGASWPAPPVRLGLNESASSWKNISGHNQFLGSFFVARIGMAVFSQQPDVGGVAKFTAVSVWRAESRPARLVQKQMMLQM